MAVGATELAAVVGVVATGTQDHRNPGSPGGTDVVRSIADHHGFLGPGAERIENGMVSRGSGFLTLSTVSPPNTAWK